VLGLEFRGSHAPCQRLTDLERFLRLDGELFDAHGGYGKSGPGLGKQADELYKPANHMGRADAHGGYLCRLDGLEGGALPRLGREALAADGQEVEGAGLLVSVFRKVVRFAYDAPHTYGRRGAQWYGRHHSLAARLSTHYGASVHAYVFDPDELEQVVTYGAGRRVGGETLRYEEAEIDSDELSEEAFETLRDRWPMARLGRLLGLTRDELLRLPYARSVLIRLDGDAVPALDPLWLEAGPQARS
jgi:hypothetical protein